ncbi:MAG: S8 family serine peptidase [Acidobacteria bacterium]|nr:S8 family serine peptidase [Acidobacteriota bacterium]
MKFLLDDPPFAGIGAGVRIAVIDSGINPDNPHVNGFVGGVAIADDGSEHDDLSDRLGHGTAVAAAIQEKAPAAELHIVRVFGTTLTTHATNIAHAIEWAAEHGMNVANLSLGTTKPESADVLAAALESARAAHLRVVSVCFHKDVRWWPGSLPGAIGVVVDEACPRDEIRLDRDVEGNRVVAASPLPRPIPGVPPERNISGISFAVANVSGFVARAMGRAGDADMPPELADLLASE